MFGCCCLLAVCCLVLIGVCGGLLHVVWCVWFVDVCGSWRVARRLQFVVNTHLLYVGC